jgi:adenosylcobyric acid synthase
MVQGTGSHVGKSLLVAGLARALVRRGLKVAPFKPQNMSNNAAVAAGGGEIGRAQALQARAAGLAASVHMNPVLLKPESDAAAQVIVQGRRHGRLDAGGFRTGRKSLLPKVLESFRAVGAGMDVVLVEGAGSPAEINLREGDIANMGFAEAADLPVVIVGDIDRGGVIASLVGTHAVLPPQERARIKGFIVNKMRGDASLFADGMRAIAERTGWRPLGLVPWFPDVVHLPAEDAVELDPQPHRHSGESRHDRESIVIAVLQLPRIANFDDLDPLRAEPGVSVRFVRAGEAIPAKAKLVIIPGSKATVADLADLRAQGWDIDLAAHVRRGGRILGLCGGYQMLGQTIADPDGVEGASGTVAGLGLLGVDSVLGGDKTTVAVAGRDAATGERITGYEIHLGRSDGADCARPLIHLEGRSDGAQSPDGLVSGTYVHGLFAADGFRRRFLAMLGAPASALRYEALVERTLDRLADYLEAHVDIDALLAIAGYRSAATEPAMTTSASKAALAPT